VHRVYLDKVRSTSAESAGGLGLIQLILAEPRASAAQARDLIQRAVEERAWILDWVETILVYKFPKLSREEIRMMLDLKDPELKKSRFYQEVFAEGREEGRRGEAAALVLRLLRHRLGALPPGSEAQVTALTRLKLEALGEALLDFTQAADLEAWLRQQG
jgi:predicted transposase YdaD